jgi:hypothetical protein
MSQGALTVKVGARSREVFNVTILADTENSVTLPGRAKKFMIKHRDSSAVLKVAFDANESGTTYITVPAYAAYWEDGLLSKDLKIYFQSPTPGVVEVVAWY